MCSAIIYTIIPSRQPGYVPNACKAETRKDDFSEKNETVKRHQHETNNTLQKAVKQQHDDVDMGRLSKAG